MDSCPVCGAVNEEDVSYCARCGEPLKEGVPRIVYYRRRGEKDEEKYEKQEKHEKDEYEEKDGHLLAQLCSPLQPSYSRRRGHIPNGLLVPRLVGQLGQPLPLLVIAFGLFIVWNVLKARERSPRPY